MLSIERLFEYFILFFSNENWDFRLQQKTMSEQRERWWWFNDIFFFLICSWEESTLKPIFYLKDWKNILINCCIKKKAIYTIQPPIPHTPVYHHLCYYQRKEKFLLLCLCCLFNFKSSTKSWILLFYDYGIFILSSNCFASSVKFSVVCWMVIPCLFYLILHECGAMVNWWKMGWRSIDFLIF